MIQTGIVSKVKIQDVLSNQLPQFIREESPLSIDFLKQYYISQEYQGGPANIGYNLDQYLDVNNLTPEMVVDSTTTTGITTTGDDTINVSSTKGFPSSYGLLKIDDEIITYTGITTNTFTGCKRGFSGITSYHSDNNQEDLVFSTSLASEHDESSTIQNLSTLFLKEFYRKFKSTFLPGLEGTSFQSQLDVGTFIGEARSLYQTKGTEESFRILFNVLYGVTPKVLNLEERLIKPSFANYIRRRICIAELISGNPIKLRGQNLLKGLTGQTLFRSDLDSSINASISEVEPFERTGTGAVGFTTYYKIGLFVGYDETSDVKNDFIVVPNTKAIESVGVGASILTVDSTIGFSTSGKVISGINTITYTDKTVNQFIGCTGITSTISPIDNVRSDITYFGFEDGDLDKKVVLRLTGVLSEFEQEGNIDVEEGEIISIKSIGDKVENPTLNKSYKEVFCNSWIYNTSSSYFVEQVISSSQFLVKSVVDRSSLKKGDFVEIVNQDTNQIIPSGNPYVNDITVVSNNTLISLNDSSFTEQSGTSYKIRKKLNKPSSSGAPIEYGNDAFISDVVNVYTTEQDAYVASNSLPSFLSGTNSDFSKQIDISVKSIILNIASGAGNLIGQLEDNRFSQIEFDVDVPFITGDQVFYSTSDGDSLIGLTEGSYFVKVFKNSGGNPRIVELYTSAGGIADEQKLAFSKSSSDGIHKFILSSQSSEVIGAQKLLKKFPLKQETSAPPFKAGPETFRLDNSTPVGSVGMLINGVEISNYKSNDKVFFGPLSEVSVLNGGDDFDAINLPNITVSTGIGTTALVQPVVSGKVEDVFIDPQNFDLDKIISIGVTGGNGSGCVLEPVVSTRFREELFNGSPSTAGGGINTSSLAESSFGRIVFLRDHQFETGEPIIYQSGSNAPLDIKVGVNTGLLVDNAQYFPEFISSNTIRIYETKDNLEAGINTITFDNSNGSGNHIFKVGERNTLIDVRVFNGGDNYTNRKLFVKPTGISTSSDTINFVNHGFSSGELVEYEHAGSPISGLDIGKKYYILKVDDNSFRLADAGFDGKTTSNFDRGNFVALNSTGVGNQTFKYPDIKAFAEFVSVGSSTIVDGIPISIELTPKVRGSIIDSYLYETGTGYGSTIINNHRKPIISVKTGKFASFKPIVVNGKIVGIRTEFSGQEYYSAPDLEIIDPTGAGAGAKLRPVIGLNASGTDSIIKNVIIVNPGIGYSTDTVINVKSAGKNAFLDSEVRSLTINKHSEENNYQLLENSENKLKYSVTGYDISLFKDDASERSGIIGWAYDGNPIYGPFAYENPQSTDTDLSNAVVKKMVSGYIKDPNNISDRPQGFDDGFFVEDYRFGDPEGDLDEFNGRFEITNEFPNGAYVYHAVVGNSNIPEFPYFIGKSYRSNIVEDNFSTIDQTNFDYNSNKVLRNTLPYKVADKFANNDFLVETSEIEDQKIEIESISSGSVTEFKIISSGTGYKVDEFLNFDNTGTNGDGLISVISNINGKFISSITAEVTTIPNSVATWSENEINFFTPTPHNLQTNDFVNISGLSTDISELNGTFKVGVTTFSVATLSTITGAPAAGFTTEIFVSDIPTIISAGSSIGIGTETLRILNIYRDLNILTVERETTTDNIHTIQHPKGSVVNYLTNKISITKSLPSFKSQVNEKIFFNPSESVGIGTSAGDEREVSFPFAGSDITRNIPVKQIYIENHPFKTNQKVKFSTPTGAGGENLPVSNNDGASSFSLPENVYVVNKNINSIGIKTEINSDEISFITIPSVIEIRRDKYSLETIFDQVTSTIDEIKTTVTTGESHGLETGDQISLSVSPGLSVGIGTSSSVRVTRDAVTGHVLFNSLGFTSLGINTVTNSINIDNHKLVTGDKIKYTADILPEGLENKNYFVYKLDDNNIKLSETKTDSLKQIPNVVGIASTGGNTQLVSLINPEIRSVKNNNLVFDLSDSSLSGYDFNLYFDEDYKYNFVTDSSTNIFSISTSGSNGSVGAALTIGYGTSIPNILFYNLERFGTISTTDTEVQNYSKISFIDSEYNGSYQIIKTSDTTFDLFIGNVPEKLSYNAADCEQLSYTTNSKTTTGSINDLKIISGGSNYKKLPNFVGIAGTTTGTGAVIVPVSSSIGNVEQVRIINEGFEYSSDRTLQPESRISPTLDIKNTNTLGIVTVTNGGNFYIEAPNIIIVDTNTNQEIRSGFLEPVMLENSVASINIVETPKGLPANPVLIRAVNNTNGITINSVISNSQPGTAYTCRIQKFPTDAPAFTVGDKVFVEGIKKVGTAGSGFNSKDYGYKLLEVSKYIKDVNGEDEVTIDLSQTETNFVNTGIAVTELVGEFIFASIINESDYPSFTPTQNQSEFFKESVNVSRDGVDIDGQFEITRVLNGQLKIFASETIKAEDIITGKTSGSQCTISKVSENKGRLKTDFSTLKGLGWDDNIGKLDEDFQVIPDNDYYQNMSYSVQSPIEWKELETPVNNLLHTSGMKNFADTGISSTSDASMTSSEDMTVIVDLTDQKRVDAVTRVDMVKDVNVVDDAGKFILFENIRLSDYISCNTNDVLIMDDISNEFSNLQGDPNQFIDLLQYPTESGSEFFNSVLSVTRSTSGTNFNKIEISDLILLSNGTKNVLVQKSNLLNSGDGQINDINKEFVRYSIHEDKNREIDSLRFSPATNPDALNDVDYDIKLFTSEFNTESIGIGTSSIGPINLNSRNQLCSSGITTDILSVNKNEFESLYATIHVVDIATDEMNLVESYVSHTGTDTFITEKYINTDDNSLSLNRLGIVTSVISGSNLILKYENTGGNTLKLKSKVVGIGTTGTANETFRFKSIGQEDESERTSIYSGVSSSTNIGICTFITLNSLLFNAAKSVVEVSIGASKAIHEVLFLHDGTDAYAQQSGSLSISKDYTSEYDPSLGLGTFGATLSGNKFKLQFFPDNVSGVSTVVALNHSIYKEVDLVNTPQTLTYGVISENNSVQLYNSITGNRINKLEFTPKVNSVPIFGKTFDPTDSSKFISTTGQFNIPNHFFRDDEELFYVPKSTFVGIGSTALQYKLSGVGIHTLPNRVFVVNSTKDSFFISTTKAGTAVTFVSLGEGNAHEFNMVKANEKSLISVDNIAQYPLIRSDVTHTLNTNAGSIGVTTDIIHLSGITTISTNDILKIDDEFVKVNVVGFATTGGGAVGTSGTFKTVKVERGFVGSAASTHSDGTTITRFRGSYNIVGQNIFFTQPPRGDVTKTKNINDLDIPTSDFAGRVYLRNNYDSNTIYDDVSDQFTGIQSSFTLKVGGANTIGIGTSGGSGILFINGLFQSPSTDFNPNKNFKIIESGSGATGVSTVIFTGITSSDGTVFTSNNINTNELPRGGIPISIGNTINGLGYAPLVGARVKALTDADGTITSIVGTAYSGSNLVIQNANYDNLTGIMTVKTENEHPFINSGDFVLLDNINFTPSLTLRKNEYEVVSISATNVFGINVGTSTISHAYQNSGDAYPFEPNLSFGSGYNNIVSIGVTVFDLGYEHKFVTADTNAISGSKTPIDADYDPVTGILQLTVPNHGLSNGNTITIADGSLYFTCSKDDFQTIHQYPRSTDPVSGISTEVTKLTDDRFSVDVGANVGSGAVITATPLVGAGGSLAFNITGVGTDYKDPRVFVSEPSYSNLPVRGVSRRGIGNTTDTGTDLRVNAIVTPLAGIGSTLFEVSEYEIVNKGFAFKEGDVVEAVGLVTAKGLSQVEERSTLTIEKTFSDNFALWQFGDFDYIDSIKNLQDGERTSFQIKVNSQLVSVELDELTINSSVNIENIFLVIANGVIQKPKESYNIIGGTIINFVEAPIPEDDITILFYKGTTGEDSIVNLAEKLTIEPGDEVQIVGVGIGSTNFIKEQDKRTVVNLDTSKTLETTIYRNQGINEDVFRSLTLLKQKEDKIINRTLVPKTRVSIEPRITPAAKIIGDVGITTTEVFVDNADLFNYEDLDPGNEDFAFDIIKKNSTNFVNASATATVSVAGTISAISVGETGFGYVSAVVSIAAPPAIISANSGTIEPSNPIVGVGTTATATATIVNGHVEKITVDNPGLGYTSAPNVLISSPVNYTNTRETIAPSAGSNITIQSSTGRITGIGTTSLSSKLGIKFTIKSDDTSTFNPIAVGKPIYIFDTRVGSGVTSMQQSGIGTVGIGNTFVDNVYIVGTFENKGSGVGVMTCFIHPDSTHAGISSTGSLSQPVGKYSVGKVFDFVRGSNPISIGVTGLTVTSTGISTFPTIKRTGGQNTFEQTGAILPEK